jgi:alpha-tubulin suppressor-like RCC1 family protein
MRGIDRGGRVASEFELDCGSWLSPNVRQLVALLGLCLVVVFAANLVASASASASIMVWGDNHSGELGNGNATGPEACGQRACSKTPVEVSGVSEVSAVSAGFQYDLALLKNGTAMAWGGNYLAELGSGTTTGPEKCNQNEGAFFEYPCSTLPVALAGLSGATALSGGDPTGLALVGAGKVVSWGENSFGQLGEGTDSGPEECLLEGVEHPCSATPVPVTGLTGVTAISAGDGNPLGLLGNGTVMAWGNNYYGELGDGTDNGPETCGGNPCSTAPTPVSGLSGVTAIASEGTTDLALLRNGTVMAWGGNYDGQLGDGTNSGPETCNSSEPCSTVPTSVSGLSGVTAISTRGDTSLALLSNGTVMAWGANYDGQLGDGTDSGPETCEGFACSTVPVSVTGLTGVMAISAGGGYNLALLRNGTVMAWGYNGMGELGDGTTTLSDVPVPVSGLGGVTTIAAGDGQSVALVGRPSVATESASAVTKASATLNATVNPNGHAVSECKFEYGTSISYNNEVSCTSSPGSGDSPVAVSAPLAGLTENTIYHYRIVAKNAEGTTEGSDATFTTLLNSQSGTSSTPGGSATASDGSALTATASGGEGTVTAGQYGSDPVGSQPVRAAGSYIDVYLSPGSTFTSLHFTDCELDGAATLEWWNPAANSGAGKYEPVSDETSASGTPPCITVTVNNSTSPDLAQMTGTVFAGVVAAGPKPTLKKLSAKKGTTAGGTSVTITGTGFAGVSEVKFGSKAATQVTFHSDTSITALTPAASAGKVDVTVTTPNSTSAASSKYAFTYTTPKKKK